MSITLQVSAPQKLVTYKTPLFHCCTPESLLLANLRVQRTCSLEPRKGIPVLKDTFAHVSTFFLPYNDQVIARPGTFYLRK